MILSSLHVSVHKIAAKHITAGVCVWENVIPYKLTKRNCFWSLCRECYSCRCYIDNKVLFLVSVPPHLLTLPLNCERQLDSISKVYMPPPQVHGGCQCQPILASIPYFSITTCALGEGKNSVANM